ncbi:MAG: hypothetical protein AAGF12_12135 [Myxococcota bacterium]
MAKKGLRVAEDRDGLGLQTIMDRGLASRWGVPYVHLAAFAIDVDRIREEVEGEALDSRWPTGWEVYLTGVYLTEHVDPARDFELLEDIAASIMEGGAALGAQLPFAIFDLVQRDRYPADLRRLFRSWRQKPIRLSRSLNELWSSRQAGTLARQCLEVELDPPAAPPTLTELTRLSEAPLDDPVR